MNRTDLLRTVLRLDAGVTGLNGLAYLALARPLEDLLGLAPSLTRPLGAFLVLFAAGLWALAARPAPARPAVLAFATANAAWALGSIAFAALDAGSPTTVGTVWIVLQALTVGAFAALQWATAPAARGAAAVDPARPRSAY